MTQLNTISLQRYAQLNYSALIGGFQMPPRPQVQWLERFQNAVARLHSHVTKLPGAWGPCLPPLGPQWPMLIDLPNRLRLRR